MAGVTQHLALADLAPALAADIARLDGATADLSPAMAAIASSLEASTLFRFETETGPDGEAWLPSQRALAEGGQTLTDTARLRQSIASQSGPDWAEIGTNVVYAGLHQFGGVIKRGARQHTTYRRLDGRTGDLTSHFVKKGKSNFAQDHQVGAYEIEMVARPFIGVGDDDEASIVEIITDHFAGAWA